MLAKVLSSAVLGVDAYLVAVEADIALGLPTFNTVGLPTSRSRRAAIALRRRSRTPASSFRRSGSP